MRLLLLSLLITCVQLAFSQPADPYTFLKDDRIFSFNGNAFELFSVDISRDMRIQVNDQAGVAVLEASKLKLVKLAVSFELVENGLPACALHVYRILIFGLKIL
jgi:hypothetical protein